MTDSQCRSKLARVDPLTLRVSSYRCPNPATHIRKATGRPCCDRCDPDVR